jgi:hypothetical protein
MAKKDKLLKAKKETKKEAKKEAKKELRRSDKKVKVDRSDVHPPSEFSS